MNSLKDPPLSVLMRRSGGVPGPIVPEEVAYRHPVELDVLISGPLLPHGYPPLLPEVDMDDLAAGGYQTAVAFSSLWMDWTKILARRHIPVEQRTR